LQCRPPSKSDTAGYSQERFLQDSKTQYPVLRRLLVAGEAAARLTEEPAPNFPRFLSLRSSECATAWFTTTARSILKSYGIRLQRICLFCERLFVSSSRNSRPIHQPANRRVDSSQLPSDRHSVNYPSGMPTGQRVSVGTWDRPSAIRPPVRSQPHATQRIAPPVPCPYTAPASPAESAANRPSQSHPACCRTQGPR